ncbi:MAG TPA: MraY family glycosyltransferase [bacterium]|mgnify:CR=1 FL=1|jgi:UDP-GlcNAc:undecaprenyl-phosphate GlcNAc-1-phosphate transferase|nr:MraY family glycosyltransferase [bacterium]HPG46691.1 MraY family glycosyltransferase [bacterium]HPM98777.1 MraY family glycosyltransferase [bacterium]
MKMIATLFVPFLLALLTTPLFRRLALRYRVYAHTNDRTVHSGSVPKLGGAAIICAFLAGLWLLGLYMPEWSLFANAKVYSLALAALVVFILGFLDDKFVLDCNIKFFVEIVVAVFLSTIGGWRVASLILPGMAAIDLGFFSYPLTVLWIVGLSNAVNLIDGLDGLASGIVICAALINAAIGLLFGNALSIYAGLLVAGAVAGFLAYNINPASIFMGDSGSLTLGMILACLTIDAAAISPGQVALFVPVVLFGIPLLDTVLAIVRRLRRGIHPFHADQEHIHHRLVRLGLSQPGAALFMVGMSLILGILAFLLAHGIHTDLELLSCLQLFY